MKLLTRAMTALSPHSPTGAPGRTYLEDVARDWG